MESPNKFRPGPMHVWHALKASLNGSSEAWHYEDAFRQELFIAAIAIFAASLVVPFRRYAEKQNDNS